MWKSDNQGVKEETFIQTGRRGRDRQVDGEDSQQGSRGRTGVDKMVAGRPSEAADCGLGGPTFACR